MGRTVSVMGARGRVGLADLGKTYALFAKRRVATARMLAAPWRRVNPAGPKDRSAR